MNRKKSASHLKCESLFLKNKHFLCITLKCEFRCVSPWWVSKSQFECEPYPAVCTCISVPIKSNSWSKGDSGARRQACRRPAMAGKGAGKDRRKEDGGGEASKEACMHSRMGARGKAGGKQPGGEGESEGEREGGGDKEGSKQASK